MLFGGTPLIPAHFESAVAKAVFNDLGQKPHKLLAGIENRILEWLTQAEPKAIMRWSRQIDLLVVPILTAEAFRKLCSFLCEHQPQAIENMPNSREYVVALARAVHLSKFINPAALDRIHNALEREGLA